MYHANKKVPGGKLIRVKLEADAQINAVRINGDFFLHPEDALPEIEKNLSGLPIDTQESDLAQQIHQALARQNAAFIGVTPEDIAQTMVEALRSSTVIPKMTVTTVPRESEVPYEQPAKQQNPADTAPSIINS